MIILVTVMVVAVSAFEITGMLKRKQIKEIVIFAVIALLSLVLGYYYTLTPHNKSLIYYVLDLFGINF